MMSPGISQSQAMDRGTRGLEEEKKESPEDGIRTKIAKLDAIISNGNISEEQKAKAQEKIKKLNDELVELLIS